MPRSEPDLRLDKIQQGLLQEIENAQGNMPAPMRPANGASTSLKSVRSKERAMTAISTSPRFTILTNKDFQ
jgi:hypothetical protein